MLSKKPNPLSYMIKNGSKNPKNNFLGTLTLLLGSLTLLMSYKLCDDFSSVDFMYLIPLFSRIIWIDKLHNVRKGFVPNKDGQENRKNPFFSYHGSNC